ncbi:Rieske (2Fe-2S) protein [Serinicoccus profundi]|uniref:Rieske (2Fe-2S) protein n=1 Tax=Serinicoccus profundi TaxID=1078471 RepID=UPI000255E661|nr:Rieske (2Fe-2S) protein [Serinicoccus profundi]
MNFHPHPRDPVQGCPATCRPAVARRQVLRGGGGAALAATVAACGGEAPDGSTDAGPATGADGEVRVPLSDVPVGGSRYLQDAEVIVVQPTEGEVVAYDATCPHSGCMVSETGDDGTLVCPCHGSAFAAADGALVSGPATEGLSPLTAQVDGADVVIVSG